MRTMVLTGIKAMEERSVSDPTLVRDTDVLLRLAAVGVCGSDVHYYVTGRIGSQIVQYPFTVGHECAAVVMQVGGAVRRVKPGDRVAVEPAMSCGECDQCRVGRPHTCRQLKFLGCPGQAEGCLSEFIVMPEACCFPVPAAMTMEQACLAEPLSIGIYAARLAAVAEGARIGILGSGPIGLSVLLAALERSVGAVYMTDRIDARVTMARRAGAAWAGNPDRENVTEAITAREPLLLDTVFECCGQQDAVDQAVDLLKPGGTLMMVGIPEVDRISFVIDKARRKELRIQNVRRQNHCMQAALDLLESGRVSTEFMVTHRFGISGTKQAFDLVHEYRDGVIKAVIGF